MYVIYHPSDGRYVSFADFSGCELTHTLSKAIYFDDIAYVYEFIITLLDFFTFEPLYVGGVPCGEN